MAVAFDIRSSIDGGTCRLAVVGELDLATAPELVRLLDAAAADAIPVQIDLSGVSFIDATGVRALLGPPAPFGPGPELVAASRPVRRLFELLGMSGRLDTPTRLPAMAVKPGGSDSLPAAPDFP